MGQFQVEEKQGGKRLDKVLAQSQPNYSRSIWQDLIERKLVKVNGKSATSKSKVQIDDEISFVVPVLDKPTTQLPVIYENKDVVVINKPPGLLVHSRRVLQEEHTVITLSPTKVFLVHRLDRATSGVILLAKNKKTQEFLQKQFSDRKVEKTYMAIVDGKVNEKSATFNWPLNRSRKNPGKYVVDHNGKEAVTRMKFIKYCDVKSLVELQPKTGRTHQLRVHMNHYNHPISGDYLYNVKNKGNSRLMLHAYKLKLSISSDNETHEFTSPLPEEFSC